GAPVAPGEGRGQHAASHGEQRDRPPVPEAALRGRPAVVGAERPHPPRRVERTHEPRLAQPRGRPGARRGRPARAGQPRPGRPERAVAAHDDDRGARGQAPEGTLERLEPPADDDRADRERREPEDVDGVAHDAEPRDGLGGVPERRERDGQRRRDLDERRTRAVEDDEEVGEALEREGDHPRRRAAGQARPVAAQRARDDRGVPREQRGLAPHLPLRAVEHRADRGQGGGGDRLVARRRVGLPDGRHADPGEGEAREEGEPPEERAPDGQAPQRRSPTRWSFRRFVVPATHMGEPEIITSTSPATTEPSPTSVASLWSIISSVVSTFRIRRDDTPHDSASRRWTSTNGVSAMIGTSGRACEMRRAEKPDWVDATIARAPSACAAAEAASETASEKPTPTRSPRRWRVASPSTARPARPAMRAITSTASAG